MENHFNWFKMSTTLQKVLLQHVMKEGFVEKSDLEELLTSYKRLYKVQTTDKTVDDFIHSINSVGK
jgi:hypothetical protein